jgi:hypothetical protein
MDKTILTRPFVHIHEYRRSVVITHYTEQSDSEDAEGSEEARGENYDNDNGGAIQGA